MKKFTMVRIKMILGFIILLLLDGCQPTPSREAVVNAVNLENEIASSSATAGVYDAPDSWKETLDIEGSEATIDIDATISVPDVTAFPVYKVSKADFDTAKVEKLVEYFTNGADVIKNKVQTKAELEENLVVAKKENDDEWTAELEEMIETAPVTVPNEIITDWDPAKKPGGSFMDENGEQVSIAATPDSFAFSYGGIDTESFHIWGNGEFGDIQISNEDAILAAKSLLHDLGIDFMTADSLEKAQRYTVLSGGAFPDVSDNPVSKGYLIRFARNIDGISGFVNNGLLFSIYDDFAYRAPLYPEEMRIYVNEAGEVQHLEWLYPQVIGEKIKDNVKLMPFEEMKQRIRDMLTFISSHYKDQKKISRIELHMTIVNVKDHPKEAMLVPAWFIYYTETFEDTSEGYEVYEQESKLVLNAVDGGRVLEVPVENDPVMQQAIEQQIAQYKNKQ